MHASLGGSGGGACSPRKMFSKLGPLKWILMDFWGVLLHPCISKIKILGGGGDLSPPYEILTLPCIVTIYNCNSNKLYYCTHFYSSVSELWILGSCKRCDSIQRDKYGWMDVYSSCHTCKSQTLSTDTRVHQNFLNEILP